MQNIVNTQLSVQTAKLDAKSTMNVLIKGQTASQGTGTAIGSADSAFLGLLGQLMQNLQAGSNGQAVKQASTLLGGNDLQTNGLAALLGQKSNSTESLLNKLMQDPKIAEILQSLLLQISNSSLSDASAANLDSLTAASNQGGQQNQMDSIQLKQMLQDVLMLIKQNSQLQDLNQLPTSFAQMVKDLLNNGPTKQDAAINQSAEPKLSNAAESQTAKPTTAGLFSMMTNGQQASTNLSNINQSLLSTPVMQAQNAASNKLVQGIHAQTAAVTILESDSSSKTAAKPQAASSLTFTQQSQSIFNLFQPQQTAVAAGSADNLTSVPIHAENFPEEMSKWISGNLKVSLNQGIQHAQITLIPENLGQVDVSISIRDGQVVAQFVADSSHAKDMLENQMAQLKSALQSQGLQVSRLEVTQGNAMNSGLFQGSGFFQDQKQRQSQYFSQDQKGKNGYDEVGFADIAAEIEQLGALSKTASSGFDISV